MTMQRVRQGTVVYAVKNCLNGTATFAAYNQGGYSHRTDRRNDRVLRLTHLGYRTKTVVWLFDSPGHAPLSAITCPDINVHYLALN